MLQSILEFQSTETISLIPNSGLQFIDFAFDAASVEGLSRQVVFVETEDAGKVDLYPVHLNPERMQYFRRKGSETREEPDSDNVYAIKADDALERFDRAWLPFPFFRRSESSFDEGPTTWARVKVVKLGTPDNQGCTHRVVLGFDTLAFERLPGQPYSAPEAPLDAKDKVLFGFCCDHDRNANFMNQAWVSDWLMDSYLRGLARQKGRPLENMRLARPGEHWAAYMALLDAIDEACVIPNIELTDIFSDHAVDPVDVSLVLDIGNSRMCGVLVEDNTEQSYADVSQTYRLELRDLSRVEEIYSEPFASRIEFAPADFGPVKFTSASKRPKREAFWWPSPVRVGPEAARLASLTDGTEGTSGLSSPKRYLWDSGLRPQAWSNNNAGMPEGSDPLEIRGPVIRRLTESGDLVSKKKGALPGLMRRYSRSSAYMLMLCELLIQAVTQINSVNVRRNRANAARPRRLRRIIMTLPTATPLAEQRVMRERITEAVELVWEVMDFGAGGDKNGRPSVHLDWDEATCTHLVFLYNEVQDKFKGSPREFFGLTARPPRNTPGQEQLRVASIDIGGGTTDLMILSHVVQPGTDTVLAPEQVFREGFRVAGDDVLKAVVEEYLLPDIASWLTAQGIVGADRIIGRIFGGNTENMGQRERTMRAQLVSQILSSAAIGLLGLYESGAAPEPAGLRLQDLLLADAVVAEPALAWFSREAGLAADQVSLLDATIPFDVARLEPIIESLLGPMIRDLCDLVRCHDCDFLLVSGRPSQFAAVQRMIVSAMPVPANRIIPMGGYSVGNWYPFRSDDHSIRDPKTTAVVGAMLAHVCSQSVGSLTLRTEQLRMRSTARFIGPMNDNGSIPVDKVLLTNVDLDTGRGVDGFDLPLAGGTFLGFRQLPIPRWTSTPLYYVYIAKPDEIRDKRLPLKVTFERNDAFSEEEEEQAKEDFKVTGVTDAQGDYVAPAAIGWRLQTMIVENQSEAGYWFDTGILKVRAA